MLSKKSLDNTTHRPPQWTPCIQKIESIKPKVYIYMVELSILVEEEKTSCFLCSLATFNSYIAIFCLLLRSRGGWGGTEWHYGATASVMNTSMSTR